MWIDINFSKVKKVVREWNNVRNRVIIVFIHISTLKIYTNLCVILYIATRRREEIINELTNKRNNQPEKWKRKKKKTWINKFLCYFFSVAHRFVCFPYVRRPHIVLNHAKRKNNWIVINILPRRYRSIVAEWERERKKNRRKIFGSWFTCELHGQAFYKHICFRVNGLKWGPWRWLRLWDGDGFLTRFQTCA